MSEIDPAKVMSRHARHTWDGVECRKTYDQDALHCEPYRLAEALVNAQREVERLTRERDEANSEIADKFIPALDHYRDAYFAMMAERDAEKARSDAAEAKVARVEALRRYIGTDSVDPEEFGPACLSAREVDAALADQPEQS